MRSPRSLEDKPARPKRNLRGVLKSIVQEQSVDIFVHDVLHTYENMKFEFETLYSFLTKGGIVLRDDIDGNNAFDEFSRTVNSKRVDLNLNFGAIQKGAD